MVIAETKVYFEGLDKAFYKKVIEMLERCWKDCIGLEVLLESDVIYV